MTARFMANSWVLLDVYSLLANYTYTVGIGKKSNTRHNRKSNVVPAKRCFVDFCKSHATSFIRVSDVGLTL